MGEGSNSLYRLKFERFPKIQSNIYFGHLGQLLAKAYDLHDYGHFWSWVIVPIVIIRKRVLMGRFLEKPFAK